MNDMTKTLQELNHQKTILEHEMFLEEEDLMSSANDPESCAYYQGKLAGLRFAVRFLDHRIEDLTRKGGF